MSAKEKEEYLDKLMEDYKDMTKEQLLEEIKELLKTTEFDYVDTVDKYSEMVRTNANLKQENEKLKSDGFYDDYISIVKISKDLNNKNEALQQENKNLSKDWLELNASRNSYRDLYRNNEQKLDKIEKCINDNGFEVWTKEYGNIEVTANDELRDILKGDGGNTSE